MEKQNTFSEVEEVLNGGHRVFNDHYSVLAKTVREKYGPDSVEAAVAQLYRDDIHGYVLDDRAYKIWVEMRRRDLQGLEDVIKRSEKLLMLREGLTWGNYVSRISGDVFARRVLIEDISLRLYNNTNEPNKFDALYAAALRQLHYIGNWMIGWANN